jgi:hypothetical protein
VAGPRQHGRITSGQPAYPGAVKKGIGFAEEQGLLAGRVAGVQRRDVIRMSRSFSA